MDIDNAAGKCLQKRRLEQPHISRQYEQLNAGVLQLLGERGFNVCREAGAELWLRDNHRRNACACRQVEIARSRNIRRHLDRTHIQSTCLDCRQNGLEIGPLTGSQNGYWKWRHRKVSCTSKAWQGSFKFQERDPPLSSVLKNSPSQDLSHARSAFNSRLN